MDVPEILEVRVARLDKGKGLFAKVPILGSSKIFHFEGILGNDAQTNVYSLQIDDDLFLESTMGFDDFLNHSCEPSCYIDFANLDLRALSDIKPAQELIYNYNTTEYDLINSTTPSNFICRCGSVNCVGEVKGFRYLTPEQQRELLPYLSPFLRRKMNF